MKNIKVDINLSDRNRARLESRSYESNYTDVPNRALPEALRGELNVMYEALSGETLPEESNTFTVRSQDGTFKRLFSPTVFSTEAGGLIIRWGDRDIEVVAADGKLSVPTSAPKLKLAFKDDTVGKYETAVLSASIAKDGTLYTMVFPVKSADFENRMTGDILDALLEESPDKIAENISVAGDPSKRGEGTGPRMQGRFVKVSAMPLGEYKLIGYRERETAYGMDYMLQAVIEEPFVASVREKDEVTEEWGDVDAEISGFCIVKPNGALKKLLAAGPIIDEENPAMLHVLEHGEFNGFRTAKVALKCTAFIEDDASFALNF